jgi:hypothetical protein
MSERIVSGGAVNDAGLQGSRQDVRANAMIRTRSARAW